MVILAEDKTIESLGVDMLYPPPPPYTQIASTLAIPGPSLYTEPEAGPSSAATGREYDAAREERELSPTDSVSRRNSMLSSPSVGLAVSASGAGTVLGGQQRVRGRGRGRTCLGTLPPHVLLQIVYSTFPQSDGLYEGESKAELQRENLYWLETSLRLVNRAFYTVSMHILRSTYLPAYESLIRRPYTSNPFPSATTNTSASVSQMRMAHREMLALDYFIALLATEDVLLDSSSLYMPREEAYKDLFEMVQPQKRLEDLVKEEGVRRGVVWVNDGTQDRPPAPEALRPPDTSTAVPTSATVTTAEGTVVLIPPSQSPSPPPNSPPPPLTPPLTPNSLATSSDPGPSPSPTKTSFSSLMSRAKQKLKRPKSPQVLTPEPYPYTHPDGSSDPPAPSTSPLTSSRPRRKVIPLPFSTLSVSFTSRRVALLYAPELTWPGDANAIGASAFGGSTFGSLSLSAVSHGKYKTRTLVEVNRTREERLDETARKLVIELKEVLEEEGL